MCVLNTTIDHCGSVVPGVTRMWIARRALANTFLYPNVARTGLSQVLSVTNNGAPVPWLEFYCETSNSFQEVLNRGEQGGLFPQEMSCIFPKMDTDKRISLEQLINDPVAVVIETKASGYWLLGQEFGLRVYNYTASPGTPGGANSYRVTFQSIGREQMRKINSAFLTNVAVNGGSNAGSSPVLNIGGLGSGGTVSNVLSTWDAVPLYQFGAFPLNTIIQ